MYFIIYVYMHHQICLFKDQYYIPFLLFFAYGSQFNALIIISSFLHQPHFQDFEFLAPHLRFLTASFCLGSCKRFT